MTDIATDIDEARLMRYARAFARKDLDYTIGPQYPLPSEDHDFWRIWRRTAYLAIQLADNEHPPPPGSTIEQLPDDILALIVKVPYVSTACETARALQNATVRHPDRVAELSKWRDKMHERCRLNNKFTGKLCTCGCHEEVE